MRSQPGRAIVPLALAIGIAGCGSPAAPVADLTQPTTALTVSGSPDMTVTVVKDTLDAGYTPEGYRSEYDIWVATPPSSTPSAGVVVGASTPVFVSTGGVLARASAASIAMGDVVQIWRQSESIYGATQSPPGTPAYASTQIVVVR